MPMPMTMPAPQPAPAAAAVIPAPIAVPAPVATVPMPFPSPATIMVPQPVMAPMIAPVMAPVMAAPVRYFAWQDLDRLVSPIALYPDAVLYQVLNASNRPEQIIQAAQLLQSGNAAYAVRSWDPTIQGLSMYPDLVRRMGADMNWVSTLGQAYSAQPQDVMSAVVRLRQQARGYRGYYY